VREGRRAILRPKKKLKNVKAICVYGAGVFIKMLTDTIFYIIVKEVRPIITQ
jgi:hypothetical protein